MSMAGTTPTPHRPLAVVGSFLRGAGTARGGRGRNIGIGCLRNWLLFPGPGKAVCRPATRRYGVGRYSGTRIRQPACNRVLENAE